MIERSTWQTDFFLQTTPSLEEVLNWTVARDAQDIRRLLEWLPLARSSKERRALLARVHELLGEVELSLNGLDSMH